MFKCNDCKKEFNEERTITGCYEEDYGLNDGYHTTYIKHICPYCESENYEEMKTCDCCGDYFEEDELIDTEESINGGIGYVCEQCAKDNDIIGG